MQAIIHPAKSSKPSRKSLCNTSWEMLWGHRKDTSLAPCSSAQAPSYSRIHMLGISLVSLCESKWNMSHNLRAWGGVTWQPHQFLHAYLTALAGPYKTSCQLLLSGYLPAQTTADWLPIPLQTHYTWLSFSRTLNNQLSALASRIFSKLEMWNGHALFLLAERSLLGEGLGSVCNSKRKWDVRGETCHSFHALTEQKQQQLFVKLVLVRFHLHI